MISTSVKQMTQMLRNLDAIIDKGRASDVDEETLFKGRLAEDMLGLDKQIQIATDTAKFAVARLSGKEAPSWADDEANLDDLKARLAKGIAYLEGFSEGDFEGWTERVITLPFASDFFLTGHDYFHQFVLPQFYFHVTTGYGILRHLGVELGKRDYLTGMNLQPKK